MEAKSMTAQLYYQKGLKCLENKEWFKAIEWFRQALQLQADYPQVEAALALAQQSLQAELVYERSLRYLELGRIEDGQAVLKQVRATVGAQTIMGNSKVRPLPPTHEWWQVWVVSLVMVVAVLLIFLVGSKLPGRYQEPIRPTVPLVIVTTPMSTVTPILPTVIPTFSPTPLPRVLAEVKFVLSDQSVATDTYQIHGGQTITIATQVYEENGQIIEANERQCDWIFYAEHKATRQTGPCQLAYQLPENLDSQLLTVVVRGQDKAKIIGSVTRSIIIRR